MPTIPLEVVDVVDPDPTFRRLRFSGAGIAPLAAAEAADAYLKLVFFPEGGRPEGPVDLKEFRAREPRESHPTVRTYTIRAADAAGGTIDVDFARHGHAGVACGWAEAARPGDVVHALGPGGRFAPDPTADALVLIGDESAFPAVCRSLEAAADPGSVVVVLESADEAHSLVPDVEPGRLVHVYRDGSTPDLTATVEALEWPAGRVQVCAHGESASVMKGLRPVLRARGVPRELMTVSGYWRRGRSEDEFREDDSLRGRLGGVLRRGAGK